VRRTLILFLVVLAIPAVASAKLKLAAIMGDGMILQRDKPAQVWGWADANAAVSVQFAGQTAQAKADGKGAWVATLKPLATSFENRTLTVKSAGDSVVIKDVLVGEVWHTGGQSNMEWTLRGAQVSDLEIGSADFPAIRFARIPHIARSTPQDDLRLEEKMGGQITWRKCDVQNVTDCTAVGYFFARRLHRYLKVPVGLIDTSWGGTMAQHWCARPSLEAIPEMKPHFEKFAARVKEWKDGGGEAGEKARFEAAKKDYLKKKAAWKKGDKPLRGPRMKPDPSVGGQPAGMFNAMIAPIAKYTVRGVLFYQGENNSFSVGWKPYPKTAPAVIQDWRAIMDEPKLPFGIIQIAGWSTRRSMTYDMNHHTNIVREIQHKVWEQTENTGLITTYDTNVTTGIHPSWKVPVGDRSARWALATVYGVKDLQWKGPVYESYQISGDKINISFKADSFRSLVISRNIDTGFYIAGKDKVFHHAQGRIIDKNKVLQLWSDAVKEPVAVRYAWSNLPHGNLYESKRGLPAYPFRTDDWPITPHQSTGSYISDKDGTGSVKE
jgi:sialate O-acetylesterase